MPALKTRRYNLGDWPIKIKECADGQIISWIAKTSTNTMTTVQDVAPTLDLVHAEACVIVKNEPNIRPQELRRKVSSLKFAPDQSLLRIIDSYASQPIQHYTNELIEDIAKPWGLCAKTVEWYRRHKSRQVKSNTRGRPRQKK
jgi:hypothetical protein